MACPFLIFLNWIGGQISQMAQVVEAVTRILPAASVQDVCPECSRRCRQRQGKLAGRKESSRCLKKAAQKLLLRWAMDVVGANAHGQKEQKNYFLFTKSSLPYLAFA